MANQAIHQLPLSTSLLPGDRVYVVREESPGVFRDVQIDASLLGTAVQQRTVTITSAEILQLGTTFKQLVPGITGKTIIPIAVKQEWVGITTPYATNTTGRIHGLGSVISSHYWGQIDLSVTPDATYITYAQFGAFHRIGVDDSLMLGVLAGNPTAGDGQLIVTTYFIQI